MNHPLVLGNLVDRVAATYVVMGRVPDDPFACALESLRAERDERCLAWLDAAAPDDARRPARGARGARATNRGVVASRRGHVVAATRRPRHDRLRRRAPSAERPVRSRRRRTSHADRASDRRGESRRRDRRASARPLLVRAPRRAARSHGPAHRRGLVRGRRDDGHRSDQRGRARVSRAPRRGGGDDDGSSSASDAHQK